MLSNLENCERLNEIFIYGNPVASEAQLMETISFAKVILERNENTHQPASRSSDEIQYIVWGKLLSMLWVYEAITANQPVRKLHGVSDYC